MVNLEKSLTSLGFKVQEIKNTKDGFVAKLVGKAPVFYLKRTRSGVLRAYHNRSDKFETTIQGLYNFTQKDADVVGTPPELTDKKGPQSVAA